MDDGLVRTWWEYGLRGVAALAFGVLTLVWPGITLMYVVALFAVFALVGGAVSVAGAIKRRQAGCDRSLVFLIGVLGVGAGIVAVDHPTFTMTALVFLVGIYAIVTGTLDIAFAVELRRVIEGEWLLIVTGLMSIVFGVLLILFPTAGALTLVWLIASYAILAGVLLLALAARAWGRTRRIDSTVTDGMDDRHGLQM